MTRKPNTSVPAEAAKGISYRYANAVLGPAEPDRLRTVTRTIMRIPTSEEELAALFRELGASSHEQWAQSQVSEGIPQLLRFHGRIDPFPDRYPSTRIFSDLASFQSAGDTDANDWAREA